MVLTREQGREDSMIANRAFFNGLQCHTLLAHVDGEYGHVCRRYAADTSDLSDGFGSYFF